MTVPYTFGTATTSIPLSNLDANFNTPITLGNTSIYLGNTTTTIGNLTLTNATISSGNVTISNITVTTANVTTANVATLSVTGTATIATANITTGNITTLTSTSITDSGLTSGRVTFAGASGLLSDSASFTWDGTSIFNAQAAGNNQTPLVVVRNTTSGTAAGSAMYWGNDASFFNGIITKFSSAHTTKPSYFEINNTNNAPVTFMVNNTEGMRLNSTGLGIGTSSPATALDVNGQITSNNTIFSNGGFSGQGAYIQRNSTGGGTLGSLLSSGSVTFETNLTERMRIDSSGNVMVGTTTAIGKFTVQGTSDVRITVNESGSSVRGDFIAQTSQAIIGTQSNHPFDVMTNGTSRMRIDTSGNLGLGVTPSAWNTFGGAAFQVKNASLISFANADLELGFNSYFDGSNYKYISNGFATRYDQVSGTHAWYKASSGTAGNTISFTQAMTLNASGQLLIGTTSAFAGNGMSITSNQNTVWTNCTDSGQNALVVQNSGVNTGSSCNLVAFNVSTIGGGTGVGAITYNGTLTVYGTTSDQRLKTNIVDAPSGNIDNIKVRSFDWKNNNTHQDYGLIAQELLEVAPYAVSTSVNPDEMMNVDFSLLVPMMIKEIQDLKARLLTLENK